VTTLSQIMLGVYTRLGMLTAGDATGGSTTTIVDSALGGSDDDWSGGAAFVIRDAGGASAAPEGEFKLITDYTASSGTITVASAWSATSSVASGDVYGLTTSEVSPAQMTRLVNEALRSLGVVPLVDTTTLDSTASQTEYTYALAWKQNPPRQVAYQGRTGDANDNRWITIRDWKYIPAAAGSTGLLVLPQLPVGRDIRIVYDGIHPVVNAFSDKINELIAEDVVVAEACYHALLWLAGREQYTNPGRIQSLNQATQEREIARARHPIWRPHRAGKVNILRNYVDPDEFTVPQP